MGIFSYMKDNPAKALGIASSALITTAAAYYFYKRRRSPNSVVQSITAAQDQQTKCKERLKSMLRSDHIHCSDIDRVEEIIDSLLLDGIPQLQVIADFDSTLTRLYYNGEKVPSCHTVVESTASLPDWFKKKTQEMKEYYLAIEFDPHLTREEKYPHMVEWVDRAHELLLTTKLHRDELQDAVRHSNLYLRENCDKLLEALHKHDIPMLIFSAGVGNVIEELLKQRYHLYDNIHIIANWMDFDHQGVLIGFKGENIHVYNKNTHAIENASYFDNISHRHNVILLGDSLGDLDIAEGIPVQENLLTIGFLNHHVEASLPAYKSHYDVVICQDDSMDFVNCLLDNIVVNSDSSAPNS